MRKTLFFILFVVYSTLSHGQLNVSLVSNLTYSDELNDIWGYVAPDDTEYALVGLTTGLSIVSLADPANPVEVQFIPGPVSNWRDIKTFSNYAYVSNETDQGVLVVDLSGLPNSISSTKWEPTLPEFDNAQLKTIHNLYIDEGRLFIAGANHQVNNGGVIIADIMTDPANPQLIGNTPNIYSHDVYVRDNKVYSSEIYAGELSIYNISDLNNVTLIGSTPTPTSFTHNAWLSDDSNVVFTTDEVRNASVAAYDISDLGNIEKLDEYRPLNSLNQDVAPHNVHVKQDWLVISHYTDGLRVVDAARPDNLIEVGFYDTFSGEDGGFEGNWGAYPFLPSGLVLLSDISNGLFVVNPNYLRAAYLEGNITDANTNMPVSDVDVYIVTPEKNTGTTNLTGDYKTGVVTPGTFDVTFSKPAYYAQTISDIELTNGVVNIQNINLVPLPVHAFNGVAKDEESGVGLADVQVVIEGNDLFYSTLTDAQGNFNLQIAEGTYTITIGVWGHQLISSNRTFTEDILNEDILLTYGYSDDFVLDFGWQASSIEPGIPGQWERGIPNGTMANNNISNPYEDVSIDIGEQAYITGNAIGSASSTDIDNGTVVLTSPVMDLTPYADPVIHYYPYFFNSGNAPNDDFIIKISNGTTEVILETITESESVWKSERAFRVKDFLTITNNMTMRFEASDYPHANFTEAGLDAFSVREVGALATNLLFLDGSSQPLKNTLSWTGNPNNHVESYVIERSSDGIHFNTIGQVPTLSSLDYQFSFSDNTFKSNVNYYRLKIVSESATNSYSNIIRLETVSENIPILLFPNPVNDYLQIQGSFDNMAKIRITDITGKTLHQQSILTNESIFTGHLPSGLYQLEIWENIKRLAVKRFVKE